MHVEVFSPDRRRPASLASTMTSYLLDRLLGRGRPPGPGDCIFCDIVAHRKDAYIIAETAEYAAFLDVLPIRAGSSCDLKRACLLARTHTRRAQGTHPQDFRAKQADSRCYYGRRRLCCSRDGVWYVVSFSVTHSRAAFKSDGLQVAANQEYAQTIDHVRSSRYVVPLTLQVHFHIVPAPTVGGNGVLDKWNKTQNSPILGRRGELTDEEGAEVAAVIRARWPRRAHL